jgi:hypothetical protein
LINKKIMAGPAESLPIYPSVPEDIEHNESTEGSVLNVLQKDFIETLHGIFGDVGLASEIDSISDITDSSPLYDEREKLFNFLENHSQKITWWRKHIEQSVNSIDREVLAEHRAFRQLTQSQLWSEIVQESQYSTPESKMQCLRLLENLAKMPGPEDDINRYKEGLLTIIILSKQKRFFSEIIQKDLEENEGKLTSLLLENKHGQIHLAAKLLGRPERNKDHITQLLSCFGKTAAYLKTPTAIFEGLAKYLVTLAGKYPDIKPAIKEAIEALGEAQKYETQYRELYLFLVSGNGCAPGFRDLFFGNEIDETTKQQIESLNLEKDRLEQQLQQERRNSEETRPPSPSSPRPDQPPRRSRADRLERPSRTSTQRQRRCAQPTTTPEPVRTSYAPPPKPRRWSRFWGSINKFFTPRPRAKPMLKAWNTRCTVGTATGAVCAGTGLTIGLVTSNPVGWVLLGTGLLVGFGYLFYWLIHRRPIYQEQQIQPPITT